MKFCGYNQYNQLGEKSTGKGINGDLCIPPLIDSHLDIVSLLSVSIYSNHTVYINKDNRAFGFGDNNGCKISPNLPPNVLNNPQEIIISDPKGNLCNFISAVCGIYYTLYLVSCGTKNNQLLYVNSQHKDRTPIFLCINGHNPFQLFGGSKTAAAVDETEGIIIITLKKIQDSKALEYKYLTDGEKVTSVACCDEYVIVSSLNGKVFVCNTREESNFFKILELEDKKIVSVSGTYDHCFAIDENGKVFGVGSNDHGQLGIGQSKTKVSKFTEITALGSYKIISASAGYYHSVFWTSDGCIYACGTNYNCELLLGYPSNNIQFIPSYSTYINGTSFCIAGFSSTVVFWGTEPPNMPNSRIQRYKDQENPEKENIAKKKTFIPKITPVIRVLDDEQIVKSGYDEDEINRLEKKMRD